MSVMNDKTAATSSADMVRKYVGKCVLKCTITPLLVVSSYTALCESYLPCRMRPSIAHQLVHILRRTGNDEGTVMSHICMHGFLDPLKCVVTMLDCLKRLNRRISVRIVTPVDGEDACCVHCPCWKIS